MTEMKSQIDLDEANEGVAWKVLATTFMAILAGVWVSAILLPRWMPGITESLLGTDIKVYWYISRGSAVIAYVLLWLSMVLGLLMTNRMTRPWPGPAISNEFHQFISILGMAFVVVHAFILIGDSYIHYSILQVLTPFTSFDYRPFWVGLGQIGFYLWLALVISFYVRKKIGNRTWRLLHFVSFCRFFGRHASWHQQRDGQHGRMDANDLLVQRWQRAFSNHLSYPDGNCWKNSNTGES